MHAQNQTVGVSLSLAQRGKGPNPLEKKHPAWIKPEKRRRFERKKAIIPAMIYENESF